MYRLIVYVNREIFLKSYQIKPESDIIYHAPIYFVQQIVGAHFYPYWARTHREIFSKSYEITLKSDYIYHASIDLEQQTDRVLGTYTRKNIFEISWNQTEISLYLYNPTLAYWEHNWGPVNIFSTIVLWCTGVLGGLDWSPMMPKDASLSDSYTHWEMFLKYYQIKPKTDCIYHAPIDLEQQTDSIRLLLTLSTSMNFHR